MSTPYVFCIIFLNGSQYEFNDSDFSEEVQANPDLSITFHRGEEFEHKRAALLEDEEILALLGSEVDHLVKKAKQASAAISIQGELQKSVFHTDITSLITAILTEHTSSTVLDMVAIQFHDASSWHLTYSSEDISQCITVMATPMEMEFDEESTEYEPYWLHTRGMLKFGLPDLSLDHIDREAIDFYYQMFSYFINGLIYKVLELKQGLNEQSILTLPLENDTQLQFECTIMGGREDPDFNNTYAEMSLLQDDDQLNEQD